MKFSRDIRSPRTVFGAGRTVAWLLQAQAMHRADKPFFIWEPFEGEPRVWSYIEFSQTVSRVSAGLIRRGVRCGAQVLIHLDNCPEFLLAWFACAHIGAVAVCTNTRSTQDELSYYANHCGAEFAVTQSTFASLVAAAMPAAREIWVTGSEDAPFPPAITRCSFSLLLQEPACSAREVRGLSPLCVQYTSGTTGRPKGVVLTHGNAVWAAKVNASHEGLNSEDIHLVYLPLFHVNAMFYSVLATLWVGGCFVLQPRFSTTRFWEVSVRNKCTWASQISFALNALAAIDVPPHFYRLWGAGISEHPLAGRFRVPTIGWWGMTETVSHPIVGDIHIPNRPRAIGYPAAEYQVAVVREDGSAVEEEETGELIVLGTPGISLFAGYLHDDDSTTTAFDGEGWFKTGDLVTVHGDGAITFADRAKDMLKVGGENVAASEIERVILSIVGVKQVAVVAGPHPTLIEVPVAFVVVDGERPEIERQILDACRHKLSGFKVPRSVKIVRKLPQATLGKIAKGILREQLRNETLSDKASL